VRLAVLAAEANEVSLDPLQWGLIPYWGKDPKGGRKPINAKAETVAKLLMFRDAYAQRRCILPVDGFFEWKAIANCPVASGNHWRGSSWRRVASRVRGELRQDKLSEPDEQNFVGIR
jgi:putative SOS response-associated peptidase YedK